MAVRIVLGGVDVTELNRDLSVTHRWNMNLDEATVTLPSNLTSASESSDLEVFLNGQLDFCGSVELVEDQGGATEMTTAFTAISPDLIYDFRYCRDLDGDFSDPSFMEDFRTGPAISAAVIEHSILHEGDMGIDAGGFASGGTPLLGSPTNHPMTLAQLFGYFCSTGKVDYVHVPLGGSRARVHVYNGNYGTDRSGSVQFRYAMGADSNCTGARRTVDKREVMNKLWDYLGPREGLQHWLGGNITGSVSLPGQPGNPLNSPPYSDIQGAVMGAVHASRAAYRTRMLVQSFEQFSNTNEAMAAKAFYFRRWQAESYLRARPKVMVDITPDPGTYPSFGCGDFIGVQAGSSFRGGFAGRQRVMEYSYRVNTEGVVQLGSPIGQTGVPAVTATMSAENP